jgi:hypothetical protein
MMTWNPEPKAKAILDVAWKAIQSVSYKVTVRWVFYRLLQSGVYNEKKDYKHLIHLLSKARKSFYQGWRPYTLADDTRSPIIMQHRGMYELFLRGGGFKDEAEWMKALREELNCPLRRWSTQPLYMEYYYEAKAMGAQFLYHANENVPLLAFGGDCTVGPKWDCAMRLAAAYMMYRTPIKICYFGDFDPKGLVIGESAWKDIKLWAVAKVIRELNADDEECDMTTEEVESYFQFQRIGINKEHIKKYNIMENPERPGAYQWEALDDDSAKALIQSANDMLDMDAFAAIEKQEVEVKKQNLWRFAVEGEGEGDSSDDSEDDEDEDETCSGDICATCMSNLYSPDGGLTWACKKCNPEMFE